MDHRRRTHTDGQKSTFYFGLEDLTGNELTNAPTFEVGDVQLLIDSSDTPGAQDWVNATNLPIWKGNGMAKIKLTTAEMSCQICVIRIVDQTVPAAWKMIKFPFHTGGDQFALLDGT